MLNSDYAIQMLAHQHHQELLDEAANERLARIALSGRQPWWRRLLARRATSRRPRIALPGDSGVPFAGLSPAQHAR